jgi:hypothetical protein
MNFLNGIGTRTDSPIKRVLGGSTTIDIPSTGTQSVHDFTLTVTGAAVGDIVQLGVTLIGSATDAVRVFNAWVSAANTVKIRMATGGFTANPASTTFTVLVFKT